MAIIKPFKAYRPVKEHVKDIAALPYDVMSSKEARTMAKDNKYSFLHVDRAEVNLPESIDEYDEVVYDTARNVLENMIEEGLYIQEKVSAIYIYQQIMEGRGQKGIVCCTSVDDYLNDVIKKHERTRLLKEIDRINHVDKCNANTGPIFLTYRNNDEISSIVEEWSSKEPIYDFVSEDGNGHKVWIIDDNIVIERLVKLFKDINYLYIADGHHRSASAVKVALKRRNNLKNYTGNEEFNYFLSIIYPDTELKVFDYNRTVKDLNGLSEEEFFKRLKESFYLSKSEENQPVKPSKKHEFGMYIDKQWFVLRAKEGTFDESNPIESLDVSILQNNILMPILGINDPTKSERIEFIGGIRGLKELENRADTDMKVSFSMYATTIEDIMNVADSGMVMPPKSTWFEPKPRSGIFIHKL
ncbi:MAG: DUF1015 family protein [Clostridium sp.]|nr:DUF1015 family protein [Clostridium sp.]